MDFVTPSKSSVVRPVFDESVIELSPFSGEIARDGRKVFVEIFRLDAESAEWTMEVLSDEDISTIWLKAFASDKQAFQAFEEAATDFGIAAFSNEAFAREG